MIAPWEAGLMIAPTTGSSAAFSRRAVAALYLARQRVADAGCVLAPVSYERTDGLAANRILRQEPLPGRRIRKGERIELVASSP